MHRAAVAAALLLCGAAFAQDATVLRTRSLAAACANCHGTDGRALPGAEVSGLAGLPADYLIAQMKAFRDGTREATVMRQIARGYSDAQVAQLAGFFASQSASQKP